jgi:hypothetical protein
MVGAGGATGASFAFTKPNSLATSSGNTPEKRIEKKLRKAAETRDKNLPLYQRISTVGF